MCFPRRRSFVLIEVLISFCLISLFSISVLSMTKSQIKGYTNLSREIRMESLSDETLARLITDFISTYTTFESALKAAETFSEAPELTSDGILIERAITIKEQAPKSKENDSLPPNMIKLSFDVLAQDPLNKKGANKRANRVSKGVRIVIKEGFR